MTSKVAVVTGGAGGIGQAVVKRLAESGFSACIVDKNEKAGQELVDQCRQNYEAAFYRADLTQRAEIKDLFESIHAKFRQVDVLVNLAGGTLHKHPIAEFP